VIFRFRVFILSICLSSLAIAAADSQHEFTSLFKKYTEFKVLKVKFAQEKHVKELKTPLKSSGVLEIDRSRSRFVWEVKEPGHILVEIEPNQISIESGSGAGKKRQVYDRKTMGEDTKTWQTLSVWLDFNPDKVVAGYTVIKIAPLTFKLEPKAAAGPFRSLTATATRSGDLERLEMIENSGDRMVFSFSPPAVMKR